MPGSQRNRIRWHCFQCVGRARQRGLSRSGFVVRRTVVWRMPCGQRYGSRCYRRVSQVLPRALGGSGIAWVPRPGTAPVPWLPTWVPVVGNGTSRVADHPGYRLRNKPQLRKDATGYLPGDFRVSGALPRPLLRLSPIRRIAGSLCGMPETPMSMPAPLILATPRALQKALSLLGFEWTPCPSASCRALARRA
jgi:hypothetical protein